MNLLNKNGQWWTSLTLISISILLLSTTFMWMTTEKENKDLKVQLQKGTSEKQIQDSLTIVKLINEKDSLYNELFIQKNIVGRYEMGLDFLKERRPNEHNLIMNYISTQTE